MYVWVDGNRMGRYQTDSAALGQPLYDFIGKKGGEWLGKVTNKPGLGQKLGGLLGQTLGKYEVNTTRSDTFQNRGNRAFGNVGNKKGSMKVKKPTSTLGKGLVIVNNRPN